MPGLLNVPAFCWSVRPCASQHCPEMRAEPLGNPMRPYSEEGVSFARYGPYAFGGLRSFMIDPLLFASIV